ncbi:MAG TPA: hypothetical protein VK468_10155 [Pyrinomonadaceae bacterium]|nr:hypothetical protein [Pyrinomonadaceae bacterium]
MIIRKFIVVLFCVTSACVSLSAQTNDLSGFADLLRVAPKRIKGLKLGDISPNELRGFEFFTNGKLKGLRLGISGQMDVVRALGSDCESRCSYDRNWDVVIEYYRTNVKRTYDSGGKDEKEQIIDPKFHGKIKSVRLVPRKKLRFDVLAIKDEFYKSRNVVFGHGFGTRPVNSNTVTYTDGFGLCYEVADRQAVDSSSRSLKYRKGTLLAVEYNVPNRIEDSLWVQAESPASTPTKSPT